MMFIIELSCKRLPPTNIFVCLNRFVLVLGVFFFVFWVFFSIVVFCLWLLFICFGVVFIGGGGGGGGEVYIVSVCAYLHAMESKLFPAFIYRPA